MANEIDSSQINEDQDSEDITLLNKTKGTRRSSVQTTIQLGLEKEKKIGFNRPRIRKKKSSPVWHFVKVHEDDSTSHVCRICSAVIASNGNTTNSRRHLKDHHNSVWTEYLQQMENDELVDEFVHVDIPQSENTSTTSENGVNKEGIPRKRIVLQSCVPYPKTSEKKAKLDEVFARMIAEDYEPYSMVEHSGFRRFIRNLNPRYSIPDRKTLTLTLVPDLYNKVLSQLTEQLKSARFVCITFDGWTSVAIQAFLTVTGHYLPAGSSEIRSVVLCLINSTEISHSAVEYAHRINVDVVEKFHFRENDVQIICATTDNAANMIATAKELRIKHIPCYAHSIQLVVHDIFFSKKNNAVLPEFENECNRNVSADDPDVYNFTEEDILSHDASTTSTSNISEGMLRVITKAKNIAAYFHRSTKASYALQKECRTRGVHYYRLVQCVITRWNSLYFMLKRIYNCFEAINYVIITLESRAERLTQNEYEILGDLLTCLEPFAEVTEDLAGDKQVTISLIIPSVNMLIEQLRGKEYHLRTSEGRTLLTNLISRTEVRLQKYETRIVCILATILDPRLKSKPFSNQANYRHGVQELKNEVSSLLRTRLPVDDYNSVQEEEQEVRSSSKYSQFLSTKHSAVPTTVARNQSAASATIQLNLYLDEPIIPFDSLDNPIKYWQNRVDCELKEVALKYLIIPATSVPSERMASAAGNTIRARRSCLTAEHAAQLVFLNKNSFLLDKE